MNIQLKIDNDGHITIDIGKGNMMPRWVIDNFAHLLSRFNRVSPDQVTISTKDDIEKFIELYNKNGNKYNEGGEVYRYPGPRGAAITIRDPEHLESLYLLIKQQAKMDVSGQITMDLGEFRALESTKSQHSFSEQDPLVVKKISFDQFKSEYKKKYESEFFKNPFSKMKKMLENGSIHSIEEVEKYAKEHPDSRTTGILNKLHKK